MFNVIITVFTMFSIISAQTEETIEQPDITSTQTEVTTADPEDTNRFSGAKVIQDLEMRINKLDNSQKRIILKIQSFDLTMQRELTILKKELEKDLKDLVEEMRIKNRPEIREKCACAYMFKRCVEKIKIRDEAKKQ